VPTAIVPIDALPLTVNGKLDIKALPAPDYSDAGRYRAPTGAVEAALARIFADVLGSERIGIDDSFFDLGGDSLSAMRLVAAVSAEFDIDLAVRTLFEAPTVAQLATRVGDSAGAVPPLTPQQRPAVLPLSFAQSRLWFLEQFQGPSAMYNMPVALRLSGHVDAAALRSALGDVIARHESLRTIFTATDGIPQQVILPAEQADLGWEVIDAATWSETQLHTAIDHTAHHAFDLATDIPLRAKLFRLTHDEHILVAVVHHIAADGWSIT
ncbi:condensation domain-containing protein, partial [Mycolicibacterium sp. BiH015]|uniref:condensation domain-containing protein n=1 Tax=Mycolicibacterium sp. BiH015 TaxID=3018808 RepID=UPI0022E776FF